jgi:hypothetical protein
MLPVITLIIDYSFRVLSWLLLHLRFISISKSNKISKKNSVIKILFGSLCKKDGCELNKNDKIFNENFIDITKITK